MEEKNYIYLINGKTYTLDEKDKKLLDEVIANYESKQHAMSRCEKDDTYYYIATPKVKATTEKNLDFDNDHYINANYFKEEKLARQTMLQEQLNRLLLKYSYDNGAADLSWGNSKNNHFYLWKDVTGGDITTNETGTEGNQFKIPGVVYFSNRGICGKAIEDVVEPFIKETGFKF